MKKTFKNLFCLTFIALCAISLVSCVVSEKSQLKFSELPKLEYVAGSTSQDEFLKEVIVTAGYVSMKAFMDCEYIKNVELYLDLETVSESTFENCKSLKSITLPKTVLTISHRAFYGCKELSDINISELDELSSILIEAFSGCDSLTEINLCEGLYEIGDRAFSNCKNLKKLILPKSVREIGVDIILNCPNISEIVYKGSKKDWNKIIFSDKKLFGSNTKKLLETYIKFEG